MRTLLLLLAVFFFGLVYTLCPLSLLFSDAFLDAPYQLAATLALLLLGYALLAAILGFWRPSEWRGLGGVVVAAAVVIGTLFTLLALAQEQVQEGIIALIGTLAVLLMGLGGAWLGARMRQRRTTSR